MPAYLQPAKNMNRGQQVMDRRSEVITFVFVLTLYLGLATYGVYLAHALTLAKMALCG